MRITLINQFYKPDIPPTARLTADLAEFLSLRGHDVTVIASGGGYAGTEHRAGKISYCGVKVRRVWTPQFGKSTTLKRCLDYAIFYLLAFIRMLTLSRQDIVISLTTPPYIAWAGVIHKMLHRRCKVMLWNMDCYPEVAERAGAIKPDGKIARAMKWLNRRLFNRLDHLICLDHAMADFLAPYHAKRKAVGRSLPVSVIPNWERIKDYPADKAVGRWEGVDKYRLADNFILLYMGNMGFGHDFHTILDVAERLRDDAVTFLFIGGGKRFNEVREEAAQRGLSNVVSLPYLPWPEVPQVMQMASCAFITLRNDMVGIMSPSKVHANLASSLPILYIGPKRSNVDDAVASYGCGFSARHGQINEILDFIRKLSRNPSERSLLSTKARKAFDDMYNDVHALSQFLSILPID